MRKNLLSSALLLVFISSVDACMRVTPGEPGMPATPCKNCAASLIIKSQSGEGGKPMDDDMIVKTGACAVRTFTCKGKMASIGIWGVGDAELGSINDDANTGTVSLPVTCNADGSAWQYMGMTVTRVECAAAVPIACQACNKEMTEVLMVSATAKAMDMDVVTNPLPAPRCAVRKFTCSGTNAMIEIFTGNPRMSRGPVNDSPTLATLEVKCNAAGTGWENVQLPGEPITAVECTTADVQPPVCERCAANLLEVREDVEFGKPMESDMTTAACVRTFTCMGESIEIYGGNKVWLGQVTDLDSTGMAGMAEFKVQCNAAGNGWESPDEVGTTITSVACVHPVPPPCSTCDDMAIVEMDAAPYKPMDAAITTAPGADMCKVRTFTCIGNNAKIDYFTGAGVNSGNVNDGSMTVMFPVKCNAAGTGWESAMVPGQPITSVGCSVGAPATPCKMCTMAQTMVTQLGGGSKPMNSDMIDMNGACFTRTFTCMGAANGNIEMFINGVGKGGIASPLTLTCNAAGTGWEHPALPNMPITSVECDYA